MPFVVTANCIVCKDLEGGDEAPAPSASGTPARPPEHLRPPAPGLLQTAEMPDTDDAASG